MTLYRRCFFSPIWLAAALLAGEALADTRCPQADASQKVHAASVYRDAVVAFEASPDPDNSVDLVLYTGVGSCRRTVVDKYPVEGSAPAVEAVFPYTLRGQPSLFVIIAWEINSRGVGTYGKLFQVHAYQDDGKGGLVSSKLLSDSDEMSGMEGTANGEPAHFDGKNAAELKALIDRLDLK